MVRSGHLPTTIERSYWRDADYASDAARLEALGYAVASEAENDPYVTASVPPDVGGVQGQPGRTIRRRVPIIHVIYERRPASA